MRTSTRLKLAAAASAIAVVAAAGNMTDPAGFGFFASPARAEDGSGGPENSKGNQGGQGEGSQGAQAGQGNQGGQGTGQGGPDPDSDSKGPQAGGPADTGSSGGKPVWAQEGIPEVELGRLSVARSPDQVLDRAYAEALATLTDEMIDFYNIASDDGWVALLDALSNDWDELSLIDSPLQNLSLMKEALDGTSALSDLGVTTDNDTLLAIFLGVASDKTVAISTDTVIAVTTILGDPVTGSDADDLAAAAEAIRIAVLAGHG
ncbi:hypothetical protein ACRDNQ_04470 [Palleronia sp. KMU-117]|uniref:hypothetical protein n=1 Tax=Palleronia sp. KMU-117 TaxID=3434108 RepID=UPI003D7056B5